MKVGTVVKRNGRTEKFDTGKIKEAVLQSTRGIPYVSNIELESNLSTYFREGIKTSEINDNMVLAALNLANEYESPEWLKVAGRLQLRTLISSKVKKRKYEYIGNFPEHIKAMKGVYSEYVDVYTGKDIKELSNFICYDRDNLYDYTAIRNLDLRYLLEDELPQEMFMVLAMCIHSKQLNGVYRRKEILNRVKTTYDYLSLRKLSLATPILANLRVPNTSLSSCFILGLNDDLDSIFNGIHDVAKISKNGGGVGVNISRLRGKGSEIGGRKNASKGVNNFVKIINDTGVAVDQGGRRAGAITVSLDIWHYDILDFLDIQKEEGDLRKKSFDIFPQIVIPDIFMERVDLYNYIEDKEEKYWYLFDPHEVQKVLGFELATLWGKDFERAYKFCLKNLDKLRYKKILAKDLFKKIIKTQIETGLPYLFFKDTANKYNPNKDSGYIPSANLCCVTGDTLLKTKEGDFRIMDLVGRETEIWNGEKWSKVVPQVTGRNRLIAEVIFKEENTLGLRRLKCTYDHKFLIKEGDVHAICTTLELKVGDKLTPWKDDQGNIHKFSVKEIKFYGVYEDIVYCVNEPEKHQVVFNGILTGNCESFSNVSPDKESHVCNLISINLYEVDEMEREDVASYAVEILDNIIDLSKPPTGYTEYHNSKYRTLGIGYLGLADWLVKNNLSYENKGEINSLFEDFAYYCVKASVDLAEERGYYPAYPKSEWAKGKILGRSITEIVSRSKKYRRWYKLQERLLLKGIRNGQIFAIAPNTSTSLFQGCTASILPPYKLFYSDYNSKGNNPIAVPLLTEHRDKYTTNREQNQKKLVECIGANIAFWVDAGISMELLFPHGVSSKEIAETIWAAWAYNNKTIYYVRLQEQELEQEDVFSAHQDTVEEFKEAKDLTFDPNVVIIEEHEKDISGVTTKQQSLKSSCSVCSN